MGGRKFDTMRRPKLYMTEVWANDAENAKH